MTLSSMSFWERVLYLLQQYGGSFARGAGVTLAIAALSTAAGCLIGFGVGVVQALPAIDRRARPLPWLLMGLARAILAAYVEIFRGTPMMVQAMFIYFGLSQLFDINLGMWTAALLIVSINTGAYMAETVRGGILSIDPGQTEGAKAIGMNHWQTMASVILPQALRNIMPQIGNNLIINIKDTCVLSVIGVVELFFSTKGVAGAYYTYFEAFTIAMVLYFVLTFGCSRLLRWWESRMDGPDSYELYDLSTGDTLTHTTGLYSYPRQPRPDSQNLDLRKGGR